MAIPSLWKKQVAGRILQNSIMNLAGSAIPALVSLCTIPYIVRQLGHDSYGIFTLVTSIIGYFALLDVNVTAGSVKFVAEHNARGERHELHAVISFGALIYCLIGASGAVLIYFLAEWLTRFVFSIPIDMTPLAVRILQIAAWGFFFSQLQVYLSSIPQSLKRFDVSAALEIFFGTAIPLLTVVLLMLGYGLFEIVTLRVMASIINVLLLLILIPRLIPDLYWVFPTRNIAHKVGAFSGYAYLSRIAAITYAHADKLIIGTLVNMAELTFYTVPFTLVNRILGFTFRLGSVLYPVASELGAVNDHEGLVRLYVSSTRYLTYLNIYFALMISLFAYPILYWWIGEEFASQGRWITVIMAIALLVDSLTNLPSLFNDGLGHPERTGFFALVRACIGVMLVVTLTYRLGIIGTALGHLIASIIMTIAFLVYIHGKTIPVTFMRVIRFGYAPSLLIAAGCGLLAYYLGLSQSLDWLQCIVLAGLVTIIYFSLGLMVIVEPAHRRELNLRYRRFLAQVGRGRRQ